MNAISNPGLVFLIPTQSLKNAFTEDSGILGTGFPAGLNDASDNWNPPSSWKFAGTKSNTVTEGSKEPALISDIHLPWNTSEVPSLNRVDPLAADNAILSAILNPPDHVPLNVSPSCTLKNPVSTVLNCLKDVNSPISVVAPAKSPRLHDRNSMAPCPPVPSRSNILEYYVFSYV